MTDSRDLTVSVLQSALGSPDEDAAGGCTVQDQHLEKEEFKDVEYLPSAMLT